MGQEASVCEQCGAGLGADVQFCRSCGKAQSSYAASRAKHKRTMVGVPLADLGGTVPPPAPVSSSAPPPPVPDHSLDDTEPADPSERVTIDPPMPEPPRPDPGAMNRTMLGVAAPDLPPSVMPTSKVPRSAVPAHDPNPPLLSETRATDHGDTLHGGNGGVTGVGDASLGGAGGGGGAMGSGPWGSGPMNGGHASGHPAEQPPGEETQLHPYAGRRMSSSPSSHPPSSASRSYPGSTRPRSRQRWAPSIAALALATVALLAAGALGFMALRGRGPEVRVLIEARPEGESLLFQVPGAPKGARLRFGGQEQTLEAGRTRFALGTDSVRVGKNAVLFDVVYPDGRVDDGRVTIQVDYRVTLDTAPLRAEHSRVDVVVSAILGTKVWLDGEQVMLDEHGRYTRHDTIDPEANASGQVEHMVRYRVEPPSGEVSIGELREVIPMTTMQIDRPGALITTDQRKVEIAGVVDKDARLTIDGSAVPVVGGRFVYQYELPAQGEYQPRLIAKASGKAPRVAVLTLRRVNDLVQAANGYNPDPNLSYAKIAPSPATYRGQRVMFEGRVYNVKVENGKSALQMLVRECPQGERCPLWINYGAATEFTVNSWVRVLGTIDGEQQFRSETDEVKSVPKVEAAFLLRAQP